MAVGNALLDVVDRVLSARNKRNEFHSVNIPSLAKQYL